MNVFERQLTSMNVFERSRDFQRTFMNADRSLKFNNVHQM